MSNKSEVVVAQLETLARQFDEIDASVRNCVASLQAGSVAPGRVRDELAQLEARLDRLQCNGVDSVDTYELLSGKDLARSLRKELTRRAEQMHDHMDEVFRQIKASTGS